MTKKDIALNEESSFEDFNSEDAFCDDLSSPGGPQEIEILGMDLITEGDVHTSLSCLDDSETISVELSCPPTVDSLELARRRLPHVVVRSGARRRRPPSPPAGGKLTRFRNGEVDSLILARRAKPQMIHINVNHTASTMKCCKDDRGLMDEVDSLSLTRRRLPHLIRKRQRPKGGPVEEVYEEYYEMIKLDDDDSSSTSTTISLHSFDSRFTTETVDSLILARKRLGIQSPAEEVTSEEESGDRIQEEDSMASDTEVSKSIPPKITATNIALGGKLRRTSSGACAA